MLVLCIVSNYIPVKSSSACDYMNSFPYIKFNDTSTKQVKRIIRLKNLHGYDELSTEILKVSAPFIVLL